jgi:Protein of unknown function (DUF3037)
MTPTTGHYSIIQYCPDLSRLEAANIGVLLFSPKHFFLQARVASDNRRVRQFFGSKGHDWQRIESFKRGLVERIEVESEAIRTVEDLESFIAKRANHLQITPPRPMRVTDPEKELAQLFLELVGGRSLAEKQTNLRQYLGQQFAQAGISAKLRKDIQVVVPAFSKRIEIPFGYQNGRFNLIQPARFRAPEAAQVITTACRYAVEGHSLYQHPDPELGDLQLVVLGEFPVGGSESKRVVRQILTEHSVQLYTRNELDRLIDEIRRTGKDLKEACPENAT